MNKEVVITIVGKEGKENTRLASRRRKKGHAKSNPYGTLFIGRVPELGPSQLTRL
jgi:hypothetical protein